MRRPVLHGRQITVIVPCFQEAKLIGRTVRSIPTWVDRIVVVDDGSRDGTAQFARDVSDARVEVLVHPCNRGVGAALITGYRACLAAGGNATDAFVVMAGDGQMAPEDLEAVATPIVRGEADYVKGDRFRHPSRSAMPLARYVGGQFFSQLTSWAVGAPISDSQCGFTALSREMAEALPLGEVWAGFGYPNDVLGHLAASGARVREVPVRAIYADEVSKLRLRHLPAIVRLVARARSRRHRTGRKLQKV